LPPNDQVRLRHILDAAIEARSILGQRTRIDLDADRVIALALVKLIEIIGEAASRLSEPTRQRYADVPLPSIIAMRNRLVHGYFEIDLDRVWDTVADDLPPLIQRLGVILAQELPQPDSSSSP
jgi:uncharacterized protein with HEPN domain